MLLAAPQPSLVPAALLVRSLLGIHMLGPADAMQHLISIHFSCPALGQALLQQQRAGMLYFVFNSRVVAVLVAHDLSSGEFVAQVGWLSAVPGDLV
jgi:hypothetical protein